MCVFSGLNIHEDGSSYMQKASMNEFFGGRNENRRFTDAEDNNLRVHKFEGDAAETDRPNSQGYVQRKDRMVLL